MDPKGDIFTQKAESKQHEDLYYGQMIVNVYRSAVVWKRNWLYVCFCMYTFLRDRNELEVLFIRNVSIETICETFLYPSCNLYKSTY